MNDQPNEVAAIAADFGGLSKWARALRHKHITTVQGWIRAGSIPRWRHQEIMAAARRRGIAGVTRERLNRCTRSETGESQ